MPSTEALADLELTADDVRDKKFYRGGGCDACNNTGYKGRVGLFELMIINDDLRDMIIRNASTDELRDAARQLRHGHAPRCGHGQGYARRHHHRRSHSRNDCGRLIETDSNETGTTLSERVAEAG